MKKSSLLLSVFLSVILSVALVSFLGLGGVAGSSKETAYERVMRTGTLRCGYMVWTKLFEKDPKTGAYSGMMYDIVEEMGRQLSLKIEWKEEVAFATAFDGLKAGRYDALCTILNITPNRARAAVFSVPVLYAPYMLYARADDTRFDYHHDRIDDPKIKVAVLDGETSQIVKKEDFPKAQAYSMPDITDIAQVLLQVSTGKADVAMTEPSSAEHFLIHNPGKLKRVGGPPVRMQAGGLTVAPGEFDLKALLDTTITMLHSTGFIEKAVMHYAVTPDSFYFPIDLWRAPKIKK